MIGRIKCFQRNPSAYRESQITESIIGMVCNNRYKNRKPRDRNIKMTFVGHFLEVLDLIPHTLLTSIMCSGDFPRDRNDRLAVQLVWLYSNIHVLAPRYGMSV